MEIVELRLDEEQIVGLVANEVLYLKVDKHSKATFEADGLGPFMYEKNGQAMPMSYHQAPDDPGRESLLPRTAPRLKQLGRQPHHRQPPERHSSTDEFRVASPCNLQFLTR